MNLSGLLGHLVHRHGVRDRADVVQGRLHAVRREDLGLGVGRGVPDGEAHHEPVELCLWQRIGALVLDGVLRGDDHERRSQLVRLRVDGDLSLLHTFEERGLRLRAGAVDLVPENDVREDRARPELEVAALLIEDVHAGHVGRQQVRRELDPAERAVDRPRDRLGQHRLAHAGDVLDQDVAFGDERGEREPDLAVLALDDLLDVLLDLPEAAAEVLPVAGRLLSSLQGDPPG